MSKARLLKKVRPDGDNSVDIFGCGDPISPEVLFDSISEMIKELGVESVSTTNQPGIDFIIRQAVKDLGLNLNVIDVSSMNGPSSRYSPLSKLSFLYRFGTSSKYKAIYIQGKSLDNHIAPFHMDLLPYFRRIFESSEGGISIDQEKEDSLDQIKKRATMHF